MFDFWLLLCLYIWQSLPFQMGYSHKHFWGRQGSKYECFKCFFRFCLSVIVSILPLLSLVLCIQSSNNSLRVVLLCAGFPWHFVILWDLLKQQFILFCIHCSLKQLTWCFGSPAWLVSVFILLWQVSFACCRSWSIICHFWWLAGRYFIGGKIQNFRRSL